MGAIMVIIGEAQLELIIMKIAKPKLKYVME
jgi:hypothetical protein